MKIPEKEKRMANFSGSTAYETIWVAGKFHAAFFHFQKMEIGMVAECFGNRRVIRYDCIFIANTDGAADIALFHINYFSTFL